jgi:hypothetical protein
MLMVRGALTASPPPKGRPPLRACPDDFDVIFVEQGRDWCESWYRASKKTVTRWLEERGKAKLIKKRAEYVAHQRSQGQWITRQTPLVEHRQVRVIVSRVPIRDRRKVSFTLARHAAQYLRTVRNGGYIISPTSNGDWWVGSKRLSPAQMLDLATRKGFEPAHLQREDEEGVDS